MYTRHFYRIDEVKSAIQFNIGKKNVEESIFWTKELIDSYEYDHLKQALYKSWFYIIGLGNIEILFKLLTLDIKLEKDVLELVYAMTMLKNSMRDCTLPVMFLYGISNPKYKNKNIYFQLPICLMQSDSHVEAFIRASLLGKYLEAWLLYITNIPSETILTKIVEVKYNNTVVKDLFVLLLQSDMNKWFKYCSFIGLLCCKEDIIIRSQGNIPRINDDTYKRINYYVSLFGKKKRRIYNVPKDCLYGNTKRGGMTYYDTNIHELYDVEYILENSKVSDEIIERYGSYESFINEGVDEYEKFMDWYFPDDIPDEWSLDDQMKSHGFGVNQKEDKPILRRYIHRWIDMKSNCKIWNKETIVITAIMNIENDFTEFYFENKMIEKYENVKNKFIEQNSNPWDFKSIKYVISTLE